MPQVHQGENSDVVHHDNVAIVRDFRLAFAPDFRMINMLELQEWLGWMGYQLEGLNIKSDPDGFFVILKARKNGKQWVHFTGGRSFADAVEAIGYEVKHDLLNWRPDKYQ